MAAPPTRVVDSPRIWATLLTNTKYLSGLLTLEYSLRKVDSKYPLVVLYTSSLEPEGLQALKARNIAVREIEYLMPSAHKDYSNEVRFYDCWSKLQPFSLVEYERVVMLDSDMLVRQNMDELMDLPLDTDGRAEGKRVFAASHACVCNPLKKPHYPKDWVPENCGYTSQNSNPKEAATTGAPATFGLGILNGGLQVVNPSKALYDKIIAVIQNPSLTGSYEFADQSLLSDTFPGQWVPLSYRYNALKTLRWCHAPIWRDDEVKNVHYILSPKPWEDRNAEDPTHKWWWEMNEARIKDEGERADGW